MKMLWNVWKSALDCTHPDFYQGHRSWLRDMDLAGLMLPQAVGPGYFAKEQWRACVWQHDSNLDRAVCPDALLKSLQAGFIVQQIQVRGRFSRNLWVMAGRVLPDALYLPWDALQRPLPSNACTVWGVEDWLEFYRQLLGLPDALHYEPRWLLPQHVPLVQLQDNAECLRLQHQQGRLGVQHFLFDPELKIPYAEFKDPDTVFIDGRTWFAEAGRWWTMRCLSVFWGKNPIKVPGTWTEDVFYRPLLLAVNTPMGLDALRCRTLVSTHRCRSWSPHTQEYAGWFGALRHG